MSRENKNVKINTISSTEVLVSLENIPSSLEAIADLVDVSVNGKDLPAYTGVISIPVTLADGTVTTVSGSISLWFDKAHVKASRKAKEKASILAKKEAEKEALKTSYMNQLQGLTQEELMKLIVEKLVK